ncbi:MAG: ABC transporter permease subunit [Actinomycetota bacterium]|nr:ABC transporter permease subunit [Actinomycetota bacterium]
MGGVLGLLVANGVLHHGIPRVLNSLFVSFSGMASNFAGVPLAFAYTSTIGASGVVTALLGHVGVHLPFDFLQTQLGLSLVYLYFQFPLMVLLVIPALQGLRTEWREAAQNLGAGTIAFWRYVGMPVLAPSLLGMVVLLFGSAFSAYATAYALGVSNLVTVQIGNYVNGNTVYDPQMAYALAFGMIVIIAVTMGLYTLLQRRASRWLR